MELDEKKIPTIFKAFCDENRVKILKLLLTGEKCACVLLDDMHITQPTLSHHMKILCDLKISRVVIGKFTYFSARLIKTSTYRQISIFLFQGGYLWIC